MRILCQGISQSRCRWILSQGISQSRCRWILCQGISQSRCKWILCQGISQSWYKLMVFTLCFRPCDLSQHQGERCHLVRGPGPVCQAVETTTLTPVCFKTNIASDISLCLEQT